jgi:hypothetical protein
LQIFSGQQYVNADRHTFVAVAAGGHRAGGHVGCAPRRAGGLPRGAAQLARLREVLLRILERSLETAVDIMGCIANSDHLTRRIDLRLERRLERAVGVVTCRRSGSSAAHRLKDLADVLEVIRAVQLPENFADSPNPCVQEKHRDLWRAAQGSDPTGMSFLIVGRLAEASTREKQFSGRR